MGNLLEKASQVDCLRPFQYWVDHPAIFDMPSSPVVAMYSSKLKVSTTLSTGCFTVTSRPVMSETDSVLAVEGEQACRAISSAKKMEISLVLFIVVPPVSGRFFRTQL